MRRWRLYLLLAAVAGSFAAVALQLSGPQVRLEWQRQRPAQGEIVVALDTRTLLISDHNYDYVHAYDLNGKQLWEFQPPHPPGMIASINVDEHACYVSTNSNWLYALDKTGKPRWQRELVTGTENWGYELSVEGRTIRAHLKSGEYYIFDSSGTPINKGKVKSQPLNPNMPSNLQLRSHTYFVPGAKSVIDTDGRMWMAEPILNKQSLNFLDRLTALLFKQKHTYNNTAQLNVRDQSGNVVAKTILPFSHVSNALALPDGTVVFIGGMGVMCCYSLSN